MYIYIYILYIYIYIYIYHFIDTIGFQPVEFPVHSRNHLSPKLQR